MTSAYVKAGPLGRATVQQLFPTGTQRLSRRPSRRPSLLVLPASRSPRLLVPSDIAASAEMLRRHRTGSTQRLGQLVFTWGLRSGLLPLLPVARLVPVAGSTGPTIEDHVREHVPGAARVGVLLGPPRANGKAVLRVFDSSGRTIAFGKVAHDDLTNRLVRHESRVLTDLARWTFRHLEVPRVLHAGDWNGRAVLYQTPLATAGDCRPTWRLPLDAMRELAEAGIDGGPSPVGSSAYVRGLRRQVSGSGAAPWLGTVLDGVIDRWGDVPLGYGRWHGDWAPWNMGSSSGPQRVWDWERSASGVPLGLDVVHFLVQGALSTGRADRPIQEWLLASAGPALSRWCSSPRAVEATVGLYLVEVLSRYVADGGDTPTPVLGRRIRTLRALVEGHLAAREEHDRADA